MIRWICSKSIFTATYNAFARRAGFGTQAGDQRRAELLGRIHHPAKHYRHDKKPDLDIAQAHCVDADGGWYRDCYCDDGLGQLRQGFRRFLGNSSVPVHPMDGDQSGGLLQGAPRQVFRYRDFQVQRHRWAPKLERHRRLRCRVVAKLPFSNTGLYTGYVTTLLEGADLSLVGVMVSAVVYWWLCRSQNIQAELLQTYHLDQN